MTRQKVMEDLLMLSTSLLFFGEIIIIAALARNLEIANLEVLLEFLGVSALLLVAMLLSRINRDVSEISRILRKK